MDNTKIGIKVDTSPDEREKQKRTRKLRLLALMEFFINQNGVNLLEHM
jgi:hypothetical protein